MTVTQFACDHLQVNAQLSEAKKKADEDMAELEEVQNARRRLDKEIEGLNERIEELGADNAKTNRSKKKIQGDVSGREAQSFQG